jgi:hypothetical protein
LKFNNEKDKNDDNDEKDKNDDNGEKDKNDDNGEKDKLMITAKRIRSIIMV